MKKFFTLILLVVCTCLISNAQFIGLRGGFSLSTIRSNMPSSQYQNSFWGDNKSIPGFQCGIFAELPLSPTAKWLTMEAGLIIQTKGSDINYNYYNFSHTSYSLESYNSSTKLYYLDIPFSVKMYTTVGKPKLYFEIGPYIGLGLSGKQHDDSGQTRKISWSSTGQSTNFDEYYKRFDCGISIGAGMKIEPIQVGLSYELGLVNMYPTMSGNKAYNRAFSIFIEFMIPHKDKSVKK